MNAPVFHGAVREGQLRMSEAARWQGYLAKYEGKRVRVTVAPETTRRSSSQNRYLWGVVYATLAEWSGHDAEELHEAFRAMFLPQQVVLATAQGQTVSVPGFTSALSIE